MSKQKSKSNIVKRQEKQMIALINNFLSEQVTHSEIKSISITDVDLGTDYDEATVFYDTLSNNADLEEALEAVAPKVKKTIADGMDLRKVPNLNFKFDEQLKEVRKIEDILTQIKQEEVKD